MNNFYQIVSNSNYKPKYHKKETLSTKEVFNRYYRVTPIKINSKS